MKDFDYKAAKAELDTMLAWFESDDVSLDEAVEKYVKAEEIIKQMQVYLHDTKAKIEQISKKAAK